MKLREIIGNATMNLASRIIGKRLFGVGREDENFMWAERYSGAGPARANLESYVGTVYSCVSLIAESVGKYQPVLYTNGGGKRKDIAQHEFLDLLDNPQPNNPSGVSSFELFSGLQTFMELQGEGFWYLVKGTNSGKVREIVQLRPDRVGVSIDSVGNVDGYFIRQTGSQSPIPLELDEVLHFKNINPKNPYRGYSTIDAIRDQIETEDYSTTFTKNFFKNNAGISGVLSLKGEVMTGAFTAFARSWRQKYEGVDNAGKVAIIRQTDAEFTKVGLGLNEIDMAALRKMTERGILMGFRVPLGLLGQSDDTGMGRGNIEALEYIFAKYNIDPKFVRIDAVLQKYVDRFYKNARITVSHVVDIPEDKDFAHTQEKDFADTVLTKNEIRARHGLEPIKGGDELYVPINYLPVDSAMSGSAKSIQPITIKMKRLVQQTGTLKKNQDNSGVINSENKEAFRLNLMRNQVAYERKYKAVVNPILIAQEQEALYNLEAKGASLIKEFTERLFNDGAADLLFSEKINPIALSLASQQGAIALVFAGDDETEFQLTQSLRRSIEASTSRMAARFNDQTLAALNNTLTEGVAAGEALSKLKARVTEVYESARGYRATRIARSESLKASNNATNDAYKQTGYVREKQWYANPGACAICEEMDGKIVGLDTNFADLGSSVTYTNADGEQQSYTVSYDDIENPPIHSNCRCTIIPVR